MADNEANIHIWWRPFGPDLVVDDNDEATVRARVLGACQDVARIIGELIPAERREFLQNVPLEDSNGIVLRQHIETALTSALQQIAVPKADYTAIENPFLGLDLPDPTSTEDPIVRFGFEPLAAGPNGPYYWYDSDGKLHCEFDYGLTINEQPVVLRLENADGWIEVFAKVGFEPQM